MTAFVIGLAICGGLPIAWHMRAVARRWPCAPDRPSGLARKPRSEAPPAAVVGSRPGRVTPRAKGRP